MKFINIAFHINRNLVVGMIAALLLFMILACGTATDSSSSVVKEKPNVKSNIDRRLYILKFTY